MATQNPIEMEGTYPLPEAQRDRFMARISMGYPAHRSEMDMLRSHGKVSPLEDLRPVVDAATVCAMIEAVREGRIGDRLAGGHDRIGRLLEEDRRIALDRAPHLLDMRLVVAPDAVDPPHREALVAAADRDAHLRRGGNDETRPVC